jgi:hypothetical protein
LFEFVWPSLVKKRVNLPAFPPFAPAVFTYLDTAIAGPECIREYGKWSGQCVSQFAFSVRPCGTVIARESFVRFWTLVSFNAAAAATDMTPKI